MRGQYLPRYDKEIKLASVLRLSKGKAIFSSLNRNNAYFMDSAAEAITFFITNLNLEPNAVVGVPLYTCSSVLQAVRVANHPIKFLDIILDETGYHLDLAQIRNIDVLVFIHYFGIYLKDLVYIREVYPSIVIVEDCSHVSYLDYSGSTSADASVFSFNLHKPISCGVGGCLVVRDTDKVLNIYENYSKLPVFSWHADMRRFFKIIFKSYAHTRFVQNITKSYLENRRKLQSLTSPYHNISPHKLSLLSKCLLGNQYRAFEDCSLKLNYLRIDEKLRLPLSEEEVKKLLYYPVFLPNKDKRDAFNRKLHEHSIDSFVLWENCLYNASYYSKETEDCSRTKKMLDRVLYLPKELITNCANLARLNGVIALLNDIDMKLQ